MKKLFFTSTCVLILLAGSAQKPQIGIVAGATLSNFKAKSEGEDQTGDSKIGMTAGVVANFAIAEKFMIQSGLHLVQKGTQDEESFGGSTASIKLTSNWIELPVNFLYNNGKFFAGAGPSLSFGIGGKWKAEFDGEEESEDVHFGNAEDDDIKGFDFGANFVAGFQFNSGLFVAANFNQGFSNLLPDDGGEGSLKSHYFGLRLGYMLKGKK
jgi:hypothetical protein